MIDVKAPQQTRRPTWDEYFLDLATVIALRSTCPRLHVGCVIVQDKRIIATGYNGAPAHADHCDDVGCLLVDGHCERAIHAEVNAIRLTRGVNIAECVAYITHKPCESCRSLLHDNGVFDIRYLYDY